MLHLASIEGWLEGSIVLGAGLRNAVLSEFELAGPVVGVLYQLTFLPL